MSIRARALFAARWRGAPRGEGDPLRSVYISKFGGCKRQDSSAKRTPRTNGKFSRRAREEVRKSYSPRAVCRPVVRAWTVARGRWRVAVAVAVAARDRWACKRRCARALRRSVRGAMAVSDR